MRQTEIGHYGSFFAFLHPPHLKTQKIRILKKWKKLLEISSFYTCQPKTTIIWGTVPEIQSEADIIFVIFPIYHIKSTWRHYPFTHVYHKWKPYDIWLLRSETRQTEFFVILGSFLPFDTPNNPKNQNFEKMKKTPEFINILHLHTTNDQHICGSWDMETGYELTFQSCIMKNYMVKIYSFYCHLKDHSDWAWWAENFVILHKIAGKWNFQQKLRY